MKLSRATISLYLGLVFVSGSVLGVVGDRYYNAYTTAKRQADRAKDRNRRVSPEEFTRDVTNYMQKRLSLSDEQVAQLRVIFDETRLQFEELQRRTVPEQQAIQSKQTERILAMLTEEQRAEYETMRKERDEFRNKNKRKGDRDRDRGFPGPGF